MITAVNTIKHLSNSAASIPASKLAPNHFENTPRINSRVPISLWRKGNVEIKGRRDINNKQYPNGMSNPSTLQTRKNLSAFSITMNKLKIQRVKNRFRFFKILYSELMALIKALRYLLGRCCKSNVLEKIKAKTTTIVKYPRVKGIKTPFSGAK